MSMAPDEPADHPRHWRRLASPIGALKPHYDVVVVGSGYGGAITAARLAGCGWRVCVLERGREFQSGDFPNTVAGALREFQVDLPGRHLFSPTALYDLRVNPDVSVFMGCGLGGTSLINAGVVLQPDPDVFTTAPWPKKIQEEAKSKLQEWFRLAYETLQAEPYPHAEKPRKFRALQAIQTTFGKNAQAELAPVAVSFKETVGANACTGCGDCVSGCNYGAKRTLTTNYLLLARKSGAQIFTEIKVRSVEKQVAVGDDPHRWTVHFEHLGSGRSRFSASPFFVTARIVILAAGALGSPEILMRSREQYHLRLSDRLGERFSGNGDVLAFAYNNADRVNAVGFGARSLQGHEAPGPCISGYIRRGQTPSRLLVEDGVIPGALSPILSLGFMLARLRGRGSPKAAGSSSLSIWRFVEETLRAGPRATMTFLAMVDDTCSGSLVYQDDRVRVRWPGAGSGRPYRELENLLREAAASRNGSYIGSPFGLVTVHPLGGCVMGDDAAQGVVDHSGAVFDPTASAPKQPFHGGLYVCDGSIIPRALGTNPLLTIAALAERTADLIGPPP